MLDPFVYFKLVTMSIRFWLRLIGPKWLVGLTALCTLVVLVLGCRETY